MGQLRIYDRGRGRLSVTLNGKEVLRSDFVQETLQDPAGRGEVRVGVYFITGEALADFLRKLGHDPERMVSEPGDTVIAGFGVFQVCGQAYDGKCPNPRPEPVRREHVQEQMVGSPSPPKECDKCGRIIPEGEGWRLRTGARMCNSCHDFVFPKVPE